jgi:2-desacetyl-2-hydroxyethyl bacteriochlorophyllide A dehydrogenase
MFDISFVSVRAKRVVFKKHKVAEIEDYEVPSPGDGEVLIQTMKTLISTGTELTLLSGEYPPNSYWAAYGKLPFIAGYSNVGKIVKLGTGIEGLREGDIVASSSPHSQYVNVNLKSRDQIEGSHVIKVPDGVRPEEATFHTLAATVINSVRLAHVSMGEATVIMGAGILGQLAVIFSRLSGSLPVIAVDPSPMRLGKAKISGATELIDPTSKPLQEEVSKLTKTRLADVVFEITGNPDVLPTGLKLLKSGGRFVILSSPRGPSKVDFHDEVNRPSRIIIGTHIESTPPEESPQNQWTYKRNVEFFYDLIVSHLIKIDHLITHTYPWSKAPEAYQFLLEDRTRAMGVILDFTG